MSNKPKPLEKADDNALVEAVCHSAHQIWQAGLGAFARAQEEGGEMFAKLVQEGEVLQKRTRGAIGDKGVGMVDTVTKMTEQVSKQAAGSLDKLERVFEDRVSRSLRRIGVPTQDDIKALSKQIDEVNRSIRLLAGSGTLNAKPARKSTENAPLAKAVAKKAVKAGTTKSVVRAAAKRSTRATPQP